MRNQSHFREIIENTNGSGPLGLGRISPFLPAQRSAGARSFCVACRPLLQVGAECDWECGLTKLCDDDVSCFSQTERERKKALRRRERKSVGGRGLREGGDGSGVTEQIDREMGCLLEVSLWASPHFQSVVNDKCAEYTRIESTVSNQIRPQRRSKSNKLLHLSLIT